MVHLIGHYGHGEHGGHVYFVNLWTHLFCCLCCWQCDGQRKPDDCPNTESPKNQPEAHLAPHNGQHHRHPWPLLSPFAPLTHLPPETWKVEKSRLWSGGCSRQLVVWLCVRARQRGVHFSSRLHNNLVKRPSMRQWDSKWLKSVLIMEVIGNRLGRFQDALCPNCCAVQFASLLLSVLVCVCVWPELLLERFMKWGGEKKRGRQRGGGRV